MRQTDASGNVSANSVPLAFTLQQTPPSAPTFALSTDSGNSTSDKITNNGEITVSGLVQNASIQYSLDSGSSWLDNGSGNTIVLNGDGAKSLIVRQVTLSGVASVSSAPLDFTLDTTVAKPVLSLKNDTGVSPSDFITKDGTVVVSNLETDATWEYSTNFGVNWTTGTGTELVLTNDENKSVIVRQKDVAGNLSESSDELFFQLDSNVNELVLALVEDTGSNNSDGITKNGAIAVTNLETGATWEYSTNAGTTWVSVGSGDRVTLTGSGEKSVIARQIDKAGNISNSSNVLKFTLETAVVSQNPTAPSAPTLTLSTDTGSSTTDGITKDGTVNISGLASGATWQYSLDGGGNWITGSGNSFVLSGDGTQTVIARQTTSAGISVNSNALAFTLDSTVVAPPLQLANNLGNTSNNITNDGTVKVSGLESNATWQYSTDGITWTTGTGTSFKLTGDGQKSVQVHQTDVAGNVSANSTLAFILQSTAKTPKLQFAIDTGTVGDNITNDGTVNVTDIEQNATWQYSTDGTTWITGTGTSFKLTGDGQKSVQVRQTDAAGNVSNASTALTFTLDATAPSTPTLQLAVDSGIVGDNITNDGTINVSGLEQNTIWEYSTDGTTWITGTGTSFKVTGTGQKTVQVRQTDVAGNVSSNGTLAFSLSSISSAPSLQLATDTGVIGDNITNDGTINVSGLEQNATWQYSTDGTTWITGTGTSFKLTGDGQKSVQVRQTDAAGNVSNPSTALAFTLDTTVASAPILQLATDTGVVGDNITNDGTINVSGLEQNATWEYSTDGITWITGSGASFKVTGTGQKTVQVRQTDIAGNVSSNGSLTFSLSGVTTAPTLQLTTDSGKVGDNITNDGTINVSGLEPNATWQYSTDGTTWITGSGSSFKLTGDGQKTVQVRQTDSAGNVSNASAALAFTLDTTVASAPTLQLATDSGKVGDNLTNDGTINVTGLEPNATWQYSTDGTTWITGSGSSFKLSGDGQKSVQVRQTDAAGNVSNASTALAFTLDTTVASAPTLQLATDSGIVGDNITNDGTINVSGLEPNATWQYSTDGTTWIAGSGTSFKVTGTGDKSVQVRQSDATGNISAAGTLAFSLSSVTTAPTLQLVTDSGKLGDNITNDGTINVSGLEKNATWQYSTDGTTWINGSGTSFKLTGDGQKSVQVRQTDTAGNVSNAGTALSFKLDTSIPALGTIIRDTVASPNNSDTFSIQVKYSDTGSGIDPTSISVNDLSISNASNVLNISNAVFDSNTNTATYTVSAPSAGWNATYAGTYNISINANEIKSIAGNAVSAVLNAQSFNMTFAKQNTLPVITGGDTATINVDELKTAVTTISATDKDNDTLSYAITGGENQSLFTIDSATGNLSFITAPTYNATSSTANTYNVLVTVSDGHGGKVNQALTVNVLSTQEKPSIIEINPQTQTLTETDSILNASGTITGKNLDKTTITPQTATAGNYGTFSVDSTGNWTYVASSAHNEFLQNKTYSDTFTVTTASGVTGDVKIDIKGTRDLPIIVNDMAKQTIETTTGANSQKILHGQITLQTAQGIDIVQNADKSWSDLDGLPVNFNSSNGKSAGTNLVKTTLTDGSTLTLNTVDGSYTYTPNVSKTVADMTDTFSVVVDSVPFTLSFNRNDLLDRDGIPDTVETNLANLANADSTSTTKPSVSGDLNGDGIPDKQQGAVTNIAWMTNKDFKDGLNNTLTSSKPIISMVVASDNAGTVDSSAQLSNVSVLPSNSSIGKPKTTTTTGNIQAPWDPLQFSIASTTNKGLKDLDPNRDGIQTLVKMDISRSGETAFNGYMKYVSAATINAYKKAGIPLITLDGEKLTTAKQAGWYDYTQRTEGGDGAHFIKDASGKIIDIEIIFTDNKFGDDNVASSQITDPSLPVIRETPVVVTPVIPEKPVEKTFESSADVSALPSDYTNLTLQDTLIDKTVTKTELVDNPLACLPNWTTNLLNIPAKISQEITTTEKVVAPLNGVGNALDNKLVGNSANNILNGLAGADTLTGGLGADTFVFGDKDVVTDFSRTQGDKIDVRGTGATNFVAAFTKHVGQIRFDSTTQTLQIDTTGDGNADMAMQLVGVLTLPVEALVLK